jgi:hypothetical protein
MIDRNNTRTGDLAYIMIINNWQLVLLNQVSATEHDEQAIN